MTRWARANNAHRKQPSDPTSWQQLKLPKSEDNPPPMDKQAALTFTVESSGTSEAGFSLLLKRKKKKLKCANTSKVDRLDGKDYKDSAESSETTNTRDNQSKKKQFKQFDRKQFDRNEFSALRMSAKEKKDLQNLKKKLATEGVPRTEIWTKIRRARSKALRSEKRRAKTCFKCRQFGHIIADCPNVDANVGAGICFRCGSTEHMSKDCRNKTRTGKGDFPFASCFVCGQRGHLSSGCPDNPDGLYINGGCCHECGSVKHLRKDCPDLQKDKEDSSEMVLHLQDHWGSADAEVENPVTIKKRETGPKVIAFK